MVIRALVPCKIVGSGQFSNELLVEVNGEKHFIDKTNLVLIHRNQITSVDNHTLIDGEVYVLSLCVVTNIVLPNGEAGFSNG